LLERVAITSLLERVASAVSVSSPVRMMGEGKASSASTFSRIGSTLERFKRDPLELGISQEALRSDLVMAGRKATTPGVSGIWGRGDIPEERRGAEETRLSEGREADVTRFSEGRDAEVTRLNEG